MVCGCFKVVVRLLLKEHLWLLFNVLKHITRSCTHFILLKLYYQGNAKIKTHLQQIPTIIVHVNRWYSQEQKLMDGIKIFVWVSTIESDQTFDTKHYLQPNLRLRQECIFLADLLTEGFSGRTFLTFNHSIGIRDTLKGIIILYFSEQLWR